MNTQDISQVPSYHQSSSIFPGYFRDYFSISSSSQLLPQIELINGIESGGLDNRIKTTKRKYKMLSKKPRREHGKSEEEEQYFRGVCRGKKGGFQALLWYRTNDSNRKRSNKVSLGAFDTKEDAAKARDLAALKIYGDSVELNFPISSYESDMELMKSMSIEEYLNSIRRKSKGFTRGESNYRGVSRNSYTKKWQARVGGGKHTKSVFLGEFGAEVEAARAYDIAIIRLKGKTPATNFDKNQYDIEGTLRCERIPIGKGASMLVQTSSAQHLQQKLRGVLRPISSTSFNENVLLQHQESGFQMNTSSSLVHGLLLDEASTIVGTYAGGSIMGVQQVQPNEFCGQPQRRCIDFLGVEQHNTFNSNSVRGIAAGIGLNGSGSNCYEHGRGSNYTGHEELCLGLPSIL